MAEERSIEQCLHVLGLEPGATLADVKEAHRFLVQTFHEDKYPAGSTMRDKAREKMVAINDAYDKLKKFFAEHPDGIPEGGWQKQGSQGTTSTDGGDMDWQAWQNQQTSGADSEVKQWQEQEKARRESLKTEEAKTQRKGIANFSLIGAWLVLAVMWMGHGCTGSEHQYSDGSTLNYMREAFEYKRKMGTATQADADRLREATDQWNKDADKNNGSMIFLYVMLAGLIYVTVFKRPNNYIKTWIDTGKFEATYADKKDTDKPKPEVKA